MFMRGNVLQPQLNEWTIAKIVLAASFRETVLTGQSFFPGKHAITGNVFCDSFCRRQHDTKCCSENYKPSKILTFKLIQYGALDFRLYNKQYLPCFYSIALNWTCIQFRMASECTPLTDNIYTNGNYISHIDFIKPLIFYCCINVHYSLIPLCHHRSTSAIV